ncbi:MAG: hypothetical protein ACOY3K_02550 [Candidatus Omnitrophota bacterium]
MRGNREGEFEGNVMQLIELLKKIIKQHPDPGQIEKAKALFKDQGLNINFCVFNFFPMSDDEFTELEEICEQYFSDEGREVGEIRGGLTDFDQDFLKKHGLQF